MQQNDAVIRTSVRRGRIARELEGGRLLVQWEDGASTEEHPLDLDYGEPQPLNKVIAHADLKAAARRH